jgi:predicted NAD-dependent protein-ADP-ribosyltransferase YbiA (DUF1768 family)
MCALKAKFEQCFLRDLLLATGDKEVVHCGLDKYWGTGLPLRDVKNCTKEDWTGENILGKLLTQVRADL